MHRRPYYENPVVRTVAVIGDLIVLNLLTVLLMLPVVTGGAALAALNSVCMKIVRKEEPSVFRAYFGSFKVNFRQATVLWLICLLVFGVFGADVFVLTRLGLKLTKVSLFLVCMIAFLLLFVFVNIFPMQAHFVNPIKVTLKNALYLSLGLFPQTFAIAVVTALPFVIIYFWDKVLPAYLLIGISGPVFLANALLSQPYRKYEPEQETDPDYIEE